jgi:hypothetical protein
MPTSQPLNENYDPRLRQLDMDFQLKYLREQQAGASRQDLQALIEQALAQQQQPMQMRNPIAGLPGR